MIKFKSMWKLMAALSFFKGSKRLCFRLWDRLVQPGRLRVRVDRLDPSVQDLLVREGLASLARQGFKDPPVIQGRLEAGDKLAPLGPQAWAALKEFLEPQVRLDQLALLELQVREAQREALERQALKAYKEYLDLLDRLGQQAIRDLLVPPAQ